MIIVRSPLRISFAGGGTDLPAFYEKYGPGVVVSTSITKYLYVTLNKKFDDKVSVRYRVHEVEDCVEDIKHSLIREVLLAYDIHSGIEMVVMSDVPARGSGLGASSALACALVAALEVMKTGSLPDKGLIAEMASKIEIYKVGSPIGKQDHYSSAYGGVSRFIFNADGSVQRDSFGSQSDFIPELESQSMLFYLNKEHEYKGGSFVQKILKDQVSEIDSRKKSYELHRDNAERLWEHMAYEVIERFMDHVNENWRIKRGLHSDISNDEIDKLIQRAYSSGATAAKVCGAGGGGFVYLMVPPSMQENVRKELSEYQELRFRFDTKGTEIIFDDMQREEAHAVC